jgi:hypothetical protein
VELADEVVQPETDGEQVEQRLEEARYEEQPASPVRPHVATEDTPRPTGPEGGGGEHPQGQRHGARFPEQAVAGAGASADALASGNAGAGSSGAERPHWNIRAT